jgi:chitinase
MNKKNVFLAIALLLVLLPAAGLFGQFKIVGYCPDYKDASITSFHYTKLTHINYAFLIPTSSGGVMALERPAQLQSMVSAAHSYGVKVLIAVGGWSYNGTPLDATFETLAKAQSSRDALVSNILNIVSQYNLDGADIDWEFPDPPQEGNGSAANFSALMASLATAMHGQGKL